MSRTLLNVILIVSLLVNTLVFCHLSVDNEGVTRHKCIHDEVSSDPVLMKGQREILPYDHDHEKMVTTQRKLQANTFTPMRITFNTDLFANNEDQDACYAVGDRVKVGNPTSDVTCTSQANNNCYVTCTSAMIATTEKKQALTGLLEKMKNEFEALLLTRRVANTITLTQPCTGYPKPSSLNVFDPAVTDLIIIVMARPKLNVLGFASFCRLEAAFSRPYIGFLSINPEYISEGFDVYGTCKHELMHVLAFSSQLYPLFVDSNGVRRTNPTSTVTRTFTDASGVDRSKSIYLLQTPEVRSQVRSHFGCDTAVGAELEEGGGSGSASSHFESRLFMNELMTPSNAYANYGASEGAFSKFTFALLEDSGWYKISNWSLAEPIYYGRNAKCGFLNNRCEDWNLNRPSYFCNSQSWSDGSTVLRCNYEHTSKGVCKINTYTTNLGYYEHLPNARQGGSQMFMDYCPMVLRDKNYDCRTGTGTKVSGEEWGAGSACFDGNAQTSSSSQRSTDARCFKYKCDNNRLSIKLGDNYVDCPADQSYLRVTNLPSGYNGFVDCPEQGYDLLCGVNSPAKQNTDGGDSSSGDSSWFCKNLGIFCPNPNSALSTHFSTKVTLAAIGATILIVHSL